jgi:hypothetical protein
MPPAFAVLSVSPTSLAFGNTVVGTTSSAQTLTLTNNGGAQATTIAVAVTAPFSRSGGSCGATLNAGANCSINIVFTPTAVGPANGTVTISANVGVAGSPVTLTGTGVAAVRSASVAPNPLAFGNWASGTSSNPAFVTVSNTGNVQLTGGSFTITAGSPRFTRSGGTCGATLAVGANCTVGVVFSPNAATAFNGSLTVAYTGATVAPTPVSLTGTGVAARGTVSISPNPLTITVPAGAFSRTGTITLTNTTAVGGSSVAVNSVAVSGSGLIWIFTKGTDNCTGVNLAPGATCTVGVTFSRFGSVGTHTGAITFTDTATGLPQSGVLTGVAQ